MSGRSASAGSSGVKLAGEEAKDRMYEPKHTKKLVRVLTVVAYMFSVSLAAIMLSGYYVFLWQPADNLRGRALAAAQQRCQQSAAQAYMQTQTQATLPTTATTTSSVSPVLEYLTRTRTTAQPALNATMHFVSTTRPLQGT